MPIQNSALVPKYRPSRSAVSGVIARLPLTISLMRICGTPIALASAYWERPRGFRKSSRSTSPGCAGGKSAIVQISSMVVDDFDVVGVALAPAKANAPLIVDMDAMLPFAVDDLRAPPSNRLERLTRDRKG